MPPVITIDACNNGPYSIPVGTPFRLTGAGTDADGDQIYYSWEQYDEDGQADDQGNGGDPTHGFIGAQAAASTIAPLFRSYPPTTNPSRSFPSIDLIRVNQYASSFEPLPTVARTLNFRLTGRDRKAGGGGIDYKSLAVTVNASGPLTVTAPNGDVNLTAGNATTVTWSNNTNALSATVNIRLSIDGGSTYPYTLVSATPNDGSQSVTIPAGVANTTSARIMVESASNTCVVFFDISNADFTITSNCQAATTNVCPTTAVNLATGNGGLNLTMNQYYGGSVNIINWNITAASPTGELANATLPNGQSCRTGWGIEKYAEFDFAVSEAGTYNLTRTNSVFAILSVFVADGYNATNPCNSIFLGSNSNGANLNTGGSVTVNLNPCTIYKAVIWSTNNENGNGTISFTGVGEIYSNSVGPGNGYSYTYAAVNTANNQISAVSNSANFASLPGGSYQVHGASYYSGVGPNPTTVNPTTWVGQTKTQILSGGSCVLFSTNSRLVNITGAPCANPPAVNTPTVTQPTCAVPLGNIVINAAGAGTLQYSVNNGASFQASNTFANQSSGTYNILVRLQADPTCTSAYAQNPVVLNTAMGCTGNCNELIASDLPIAIPATPGTINSTISVTSNGTITDVNIKNLTGTHTWISDLTFSLMSPNGTTVILLAKLCGDIDDFNITLDDAAANALSCPISAGNTQKPANALSAFNGQNPMGNWVLTIADSVDQDGGSLNGWTLEICATGGDVNCLTNVAKDELPIASGTYQASVQLTSMGTINTGSNVIFRAGNNFQI